MLSDKKILDIDFLLGVVVPILSFLTGCLTTSLLWIQGYAKRKSEEAVRRRDAERDFGHLKRNYEGMSVALADMIDRQERGFDRLADLIRGGRGDGN